MSRRDEALTAVDGLWTTVRTQIAAALDDGTSTAPHHPPSLVDRLRLAVQPPSSSQPAETAANHDGDALPSYCRADDTTTTAAADSSLPPRRARRLESKTGKLVLDLQERFGPADRIVVLQHLPDTLPTLIRGTLTLRLREPETITHVRIRLKGIVRTLVFKAHASGRHPVSDEVCFLEDSHPLWYRTDPQDGSVRPPPPGNATSPEEAAAGKLQGTFPFPFVLTIPARLTHMPHTGQPYQPRPIRPPPSFMLDGNTTSSASSAAKSSPPAAALGGFEGSCRYYLKVTLGRAGLLKLNERWIVPIVFVPRQPVPVSPSPLRELALASSSASAPATKTPDSRQDPQGWTDPGKYVTRTAMKKSSRFSRSSAGAAAAAAGWVRLEGRVPKPQKFSKAHGELLEFEVQITCADATSLARFTPATIAVSLLQRTIVSAQGISNTYDSIALHANRVTAIGGPSGYPVRGVGGAVAHEIVYSGAIKLAPALTTSFRAPNLQVAYLLCITLYQPTVPKSNGVVIPPSVHLSSLAIPVEIVSTPPRVRATQQSSSSWSVPPPGNSSSSAIGGPPPAPPPPMYPAPSGPPPPPPPPPPSRTTTTTTISPPAGPPLSSPAIDQAEESRLEELYGLPPSYFEVVENERSSSPAASGGGTASGGGGGGGGRGFFGRRGAR
ncbi:hypothetical protein RHOSPDRAFT_35220 [Rhodotorula sp. JG-1b]|nr:hypothetical protein RHOSPDRAFT_35220 [Rhodotorula sp. JG-1b]